MADDNNARYRSNAPFGRGPAPSAPATDPLAELARLIGQNDPFAEYAREPQPPAQPDPSAHYGNAPAPSYGNIPPAPQYGNEPAPHYTEPAPQYRDPPPQYGQDYSQPAAPRYPADYPPRFGGDHAGHNDWPGSPPPAPSYPSSDPFASLQPRAPQQPAAPHYDPQNYGSPGYPNQPPFADPRGAPAMDRYPPDRTGFGAAGFPTPPLYPHEPEAGGMPPPHDDEFYDDEPRGRRKGLLTVVAVLGLAVIGTAGAFGYRSMFGGSGSSGPPPVIRASGEPSKVAPPPATADASASKFSYDRFGDAGKDEQVVRREEKPVDLSKAAPRTVFPGAPAPSAPSAKPAAPATTTATANPPSAIGEPRRVRTVPIRPEQDVAATAPARQPMSVAPPRQANAAAPPNASASAPDDAPAAARPATRAPSRVASRATPPPAPALSPTTGNAPLSLSPDASNNALPPPPAQEAFPLTPPRASAPPPARVASAPASAPVSGGGSYLVQVSSQKSEADAESAYRGIKSKYSSVLGSHPHTVRRADLGTKGVYYRAMVGPFASREDAVQVCSSLKQAGGDCVVQH